MVILFFYKKHIVPQKVKKYGLENVTATLIFHMVQAMPEVS